MTDIKVTTLPNIKARTDGGMLLCYLFIIITIVSSDILWVKLSLNPIYSTIAEYTYFILACLIIIIYYTRNGLNVLLSFDTGLFALTVLTLLIAVIITEDNIRSYIFKIILVAGGFYGVRVFHFNSFYKTFRRIMAVLMVMSLLLYVMNLTQLGYAALPTQKISTGVSYTTIGLANMYNNVFYQIPRAQSVFWESGVYAAYLNILLLLELMYREKADIKYLLLVFVSILTTVSTTGYLVMLVILAAYTLSKPAKNFRTKSVIVVLLIIFFFVIAINENLMTQLTSKITSNSESFNDRWLSINGNLLIIKDSPIFGLGPVKSQTVIENYIISQGGRKSLNNLNTILANYSLFGLLPFIYYLYHLVKFSFSCMAPVMGKILVFGGLVLLLSSTGYQFSPFFTLIFMYRLGGMSEHHTDNQLANSY